MKLFKDNTEEIRKFFNAVNSNLTKFIIEHGGDLDNIISKIDDTDKVMVNIYKEQKEQRKRIEELHTKIDVIASYLADEKVRRP